MNLDELIGQMWQEEWDASEKGLWTKKLLPKVIVGDPENIFLTQALTGHGFFNAYLYKGKRQNMPTCPCLEDEQTVGHVMEYCPQCIKGRPTKHKINDERIVLREDCGPCRRPAEVLQRGMTAATLQTAIEQNDGYSRQNSHQLGGRQRCTLKNLHCHPPSIFVVMFYLNSITL